MDTTYLWVQWRQLEPNHPLLPQKIHSANDTLAALDMRELEIDSWELLGLHSCLDGEGVTTLMEVP